MKKKNDANSIVMFMHTQAMGQQYEDKECSINYSEFRFSIPNSDNSDIEPYIKLIRPTGLESSCDIALDPKKGQVSTCDIRIFVICML